jgi:hypothetical protein
MQNPGFCYRNSYVTIERFLCCEITVVMQAHIVLESTHSTVVIGLLCILFLSSFLSLIVSSKSQSSSYAFINCYISWLKRLILSQLLSWDSKRNIQKLTVLWYFTLSLIVPYVIALSGLPLKPTLQKPTLGPIEDRCISFELHLFCVCCVLMLFEISPRAWMQFIICL